MQQLFKQANPIRIAIRIYLKILRHAKPQFHKGAALAGNWISGGETIWPSSVRATVPAKIDGQGKVYLNENVRLGYNPAPKYGNGSVHLQARNIDSIIKIGTNTFISNNVSIISVNSIIIGNDCLIGDQVGIIDCDFHDINTKSRHTSEGISSPVIIGQNVWIGSRSMILKGVSIGDNSVVGAMSVVTKSVPANCISAGNPARIIKFIE